jgi:heat shock protein HtpX
VPEQFGRSELIRDPAGRDGLPYEYHDGTEWLWHGFTRHTAGIVAGLIFGWTGAWLIFWGAAAGMVLGILIVLGVIASSGLAHDLLNINTGQSVTFVGVIVGAGLGIAGGAIAVVDVLFINRPLESIISIAIGFVVTVLIVVLQAAYERFGLRLRGYRHLTREEVKRIAPLVKDVADAMSLPALPRFAMSDTPLPNAWTHMRTIVLTTGLLQILDDNELTGILAHEFHHWRRGDSVGLHAITASAWPLVLTYTIGMAMIGKRSEEGSDRPVVTRGFLSLFGWLIAWPAWLITKFIIVPATASTQRRYEYEADSAAAAIGRADALASALSKLGAFESGRTSWEEAMKATHPPVALRIDALQPASPEDWQYQEDELRGPTGREFRRLFFGLRPRR